MKKNPVLWISVIILVLVVALVVMDLFVPRKIVLGAQTGRAGRFNVKPEESALAMQYEAPYSALPAPTRSVEEELAEELNS